ncbi:hypothetical protein GH714_021110 [Hevea brasiliensis]|uniref:Uncharacterized protein n=1 Tax=Hevea brasiliensis TaxID=3981 RepID=A0A6A6LQF1_HEVBR|nr:hypothetical protein GH714_021110 [Hevea brasiliensis]
MRFTAGWRPTGACGACWATRAKTRFIGRATGTKASGACELQGTTLKRGSSTRTGAQSAAACWSLAKRGSSGEGRARRARTARGQRDETRFMRAKLLEAPGEREKRLGQLPTEEVQGAGGVLGTCWACRADGRPKTRFTGQVWCTSGPLACGPCGSSRQADEAQNEVHRTERVHGKGWGTRDRRTEMRFKRTREDWALAGSQMPG